MVLEMLQWTLKSSQNEGNIAVTSTGNNDQGYTIRSLNEELDDERNKRMKLS